MKYVHYIWLNYTSKTGLKDGILIRNGKFEATKASEFISNIPKTELIKAKPAGIKDLAKIELIAQDIIADEVRYTRTIYL